MQIERVGFGLAMRTYGMNDAHDPYEYDAMGEKVRFGNADIESNGRIFQETPLDIAATMRSLRGKMQSYRVDNEILIKAHEEENHLNASMLQSMTDILRRIKSKHRTINPEGSRSGARRRKRSSSGSSNSEGSTGGSISSCHGNKRKRRYQNSSHDEFKKERPPTFNGEVKTAQEAKSWFLGMKKYFQVQGYSINMKERVSIFNLNGRASIWWENLRQVRNINDRKIVWKQFKKYFK